MYYHAVFFMIILARLIIQARFLYAPHLKGGIRMETRVAVLAIIVNNRESVAKINDILHSYADNIIGRMGLPHRAQGINIITVIIDAPHDVISAMSGKIGRLTGVSAKTLYN